jgi:phosphate-selective porin OprO/OprP
MRYFLAGLLVLFVPGIHLAQEASQVEPRPPTPDLERRVRELEDTIRRLEGQRTVPEPNEARPTAPSAGTDGGAPPATDGPKAATTPPEEKASPATKPDAELRRPDAAGKNQDKTAPGKIPDDGWIDLSKEGWTVKLGGHVQMDYILWPHADPEIVGADNYFNYRRLRLVADGTGYGIFDFRLQMTLEPGEGQVNAFASPDVKDAYVSMNEIPWIGRIRAGNFFVPFSLEQVTNDQLNVFLERSIPTQGVFSADREVGFAFYNCTDDKYMTWSGGIFFDRISDTIKTRFDANQGTRLAGRVTWLPYYDEPSQGRYLVHTGAGVLYTHNFDQRVTFRTRPEIQRGPILIDSGALPADWYTVGGLEFAVVWGQFAMQSEAFGSYVHLTEEDPVCVGGAYVHFSYFLTGENRVYERFGQHGAQFGRNKPFTNVFAVPGGFGWGAWELKARWSHLNLSSVNSGYLNDITVGFNWYWTDRIRLMFDWIHPITSRETVFGATESDLIAMRLDFNW